MVSAVLVFAGKSVATPIIKEIVTKAFSYIGGYFSEKSMQELRDKLNRGMPKIQAVLDVVSLDQLKDKSQAMDDWLWQLRDAVEEAEDAIDELEYYELEEKADDRRIDDWGSSFDKMKHKVAKSVKRVSVLDRVAKQFTHRDTIKRLKKAMESLEKAAADVMDILKFTDFVNNRPAFGRETGSMLTTPKFVGREVEKESITQWLTKTASIEEPEIVPSTRRIPILSIVGHGGMGKTALVQSILENKDFRDFKTIWVTVSTNFVATSLISKILESVSMTAPRITELAPLQKELENKLMSVKYLLIFDDVWEEKKRDELENLFAPLRTGKSGSKILLTTRMTSVAELAANVMGVKTDRLILEGLKEDQSLVLFNHHVFSGLNSQEYQQLKPIGEQIVRKLGGCPLVTKVASATLRVNMTSGYWNTLHKSLEHFIGTTDDIMGVLRLSYYNLSTELQILFRYCSLFPQDKEFEKKELVQLWIGSGLILPARNDSLTLVDSGELYLDSLTRKSFFELKCRVNKFTSAKEEYYVMHDLIHDLATNVSSGECARITDPDMIEKEKDTVRHLHINVIGRFAVGDVKKIYRFKNLRTIIVNYDNYYAYGKDIVSAVERMVDSSKSLRLLHSSLEHTSQFGNKLGNLKHLRYILLREISPEGISAVVKLYHLMVLESRKGSSRRTKEVRYLGNLDRLRYVNIGSDEFPVSRLTCLQELYQYRVQGSIGNKVSAISDLRDLRELGLYCLENVNDQHEASSAKLNEKKYLNSLSLGWTECRDSEACEENSEARAKNSELVLDHLQPHDNIQKLEIFGYMGLKFPCWIEKPSVKSLASLRLEKCIKLEHLPFVAELVLLKTLQLVGLRKLQQIGQSSHMFGTTSVELLLPPSLHRLEVKECSELRELPILPSGLNRLDIMKCPMLKELPVLPPSLVTLRVENAGLTMLPMVGKIFSESTETKASQLEYINISYCQHLTSLEGSLLEQKLCLGYLERLEIDSCENLESASIPFEEMSGLRELRINSCPKLTIVRSAGDKLLPSSLTKINLGPCCCLDLQLQALQGLTELSELELRNCPGLVSLPSADVFKSLTSLRRLVLRDCGDLSSLGGLRGSVDYLFIHGCSKLVETPDASAGEEEHLLQVDNLQIDLPCVLLAEPLKSICRTRSLVIYDGSEMEVLPERWLLQNRASLQSLVIQEAKSLESLPSSMRDLSCLEYLKLEKAEQLKSFPDLHKLSHIHVMVIGGSYFITGKECSEEIYYGLRGRDYSELASTWVEQQKDNKRVLKRMLTGCSKNVSKGLSHFK